MPTFVWILMWVVIIGVVAVLYVRERRSGRTTPSDVDVERLRHQANAEADMRSGTHGPNFQSGGFGS